MFFECIDILVKLEHSLGNTAGNNLLVPFQSRQPSIGTELTMLIKA